MAAIGKIRQHYGILVVIIGVALLAFVLGDLLNSKGGGRIDNEIAVVNGKKISREDWSRRVEAEKSRNGGKLSNEDEFNLKEGTLYAMMKEIIMNKEYEALGLAVSDKELTDIFKGDIPNELLLQYFGNGKGELNKDAIRDIIQNYETFSDYQKLSWNYDIVLPVKQRRIEDKYLGLIRAGYYMPKKLADRYNENRNATRSADVYMIEYSTIPDVELTEADYKEYYETFKYKFQIDEEARNIEYVIFEIKPTDTDRDAAKKFIETNMKNFGEIVDLGNLITFVNNKSNVDCDTTWKKVTAFPELADFIENNDVNSIMGPYEHNNAFNAARILGKEMRDGELWAQVAIMRHDITAGKNTEKAVLNEVNEFISTNKTAEQFNATVEAKGLKKGTTKGLYRNALREYTHGINGLKNSRSIVCWAFGDDVKVGDVSQSFQLEDMYVVAVLTEIIPKGYLPYEDAIEQDQPIIMKWKKGKILAEKAKGYTDYQKMVDELKGEKREIASTSFDDPAGLFSAEERIGGTIMGMKEGVFSAPIEGGNMYAVVKVTGTTPAGETDYNKFKTDNKAIYNNSIVNNVYNTLYRYNIFAQFFYNADVENNMTKFF